MPPKKLKSEEEPENSEPIGRRRTRSAVRGPPAVPPPPPTPSSSRATTRSRARQDGTRENLDSLPMSTRRVPSRKKSVSPLRNTKTSRLRSYPDNFTIRSEDGPFEATDESEVTTPTAIPISTRLGEGNLPMLAEADESDFSTHATPDRTVPSLSGAPLHGNGISTGPALKGSLKQNAVHVTNSVKTSASRGPAASHGLGSGPASVVATTSATVTTKTATKSISGPFPALATAPPQIAPRVSFINSFLNGVSAQVSNLDAWIVNQYTKLAAHRHWKFFELTLLGLFILLFFGPFYTRYQYSYADESLDDFTSHLLNASLQTRSISKRLVIIEEQVANLDAIMATKEEFRAHQAERLQINWLSKTVGANVMLGLTSPAIPANITIKSSWWSQLWYGNSLPTGPGPGAALLPQIRDEPYPTYCVQKKEGGVKLQLAVSLSRYITPTQLIIEHWPKSEVGSFHKLISAATAPKEVELWVYNERAHTQKGSINALQWEVEENFPNHRVNEARVEKKLRLELHSPDDADYADSWLMVGRWKYDVYSIHNVQKFLIPFDLEAYNVSTKSVVVRVNSNWGSSYATCLLRARLHGIDKTESKAAESETIKKADRDENEDEDDF